MAEPTTRQEFVDFCLRRLGSPVINIDVTPEQIDDRIDEALRFYADYHWDGSMKQYYAYQVTDQDIANKYVTIPEEYTGVVSIFNVGSSIATGSGMFSLQYQIALNDLYAFSGVDLIPYWMTMENLQFIEQILVGSQPIRYNRNVNRLFLDFDMAKLAPGQFIVAEVYQDVDPETYPDVWKERWLQKYVSALIKRQWGANLSKFNGVLPSGLSYNGPAIYTEANAEATAMEDDMIANAVTTAFMIG